MDQIEGPWSPEEDDVLLNLFEKHGHDWSLICKSIPGRSAKACELRLLSLYLPFTLEEDEMLLNLIKKHGLDWSLISTSIPGRSAKTCRLRWLMLQWSFTPEEDKILQNLVEKHGYNWSLISKSISGKSDKTCELRWLSFEWSFTPEEDKILQNLVEKHGYNWSLISKSISGKSDKICELRWLSFEWSFTPEEDKILQNLVEKHGYNWSLISKSISGKSDKTCELRWLSFECSFTPEEDKILQNLVKNHGRNWSLISNSIPGRSAKTCWLRWVTLRNPLQIREDIENHWNSTLKGKSSSMTNEDITISDHNIFIQPPSIRDINSGQRRPYTNDLTLRLALGGVSDPAPSNGDMAMETGSQISIYEGNSSYQVGGVVSAHQPLSISDMARGNMSSGGTHSFSRDHSAPSWNALYKRDSSPMMIDSDSVQQFVGSEFGRNDFLEVSSKSIVQRK